MKKILLLMAVMTVAIQGLYGAWPFKNSTYAAGKTSSTVEIDSNTVTFPISDISFVCEGSYAVVKSSFSNSASDRIYVTPTVAFSTHFDTPVAFNNTNQKIVIELQPDTTCYWYIGGVK